MRHWVEVHIPQYAGGKLAGWSVKKWNVPVHYNMTYWVPDPIKPDHCDRCGHDVMDHVFDGIGHACPHAPPVAAPHPSISLGGPIVTPWRDIKHKKAINERHCKKCKNVSLRIVTKPDTQDELAFCRLCGHEEAP